MPDDNSGIFLATSCKGVLDNIFKKECFVVQKILYVPRRRILRDEIFICVSLDAIYEITLSV
jgi:hypothetical protein